MQYKNQVHERDCGLFVVQMIYKYYYNKWMPLSILRNDSEYDKFGINIFNLTKLLKKYGIETNVLEGDFYSFKSLKIKEPIISIVKNDNYYHYIVIEKITNKNNVIYYDPIKGKMKISLKDFQKIFCNIIIPCKKYNIQINLDKSNLKIFNDDFIKEKIVLLFISIFIMALTFIGTSYIKIILDQFISLNHSKNLIIVSFLFFIISMINIILNIINEFIIHKINLKQQLKLIEKYIEKLRKIKWNKISSYDEKFHLKNIEIISIINSFQSRYIPLIGVNSFTFLISSIILFILDVQIFLLTILSGGIIFLISFSLGKKIKYFENKNLELNILFKKEFLNIINSLEQYKISSIKNYMNHKLFYSIDNLISTQIKSTNFNFFHLFLQLLIKTITNFLIIILAIFQVWKNDLSIGQIFIFLTTYNYFIESFIFIMSIFVQKPIIDQYKENIESFFILSEESNNGENEVQNIKNIEFKSFNYSNNKLDLYIDNLSINQHTKLTGKIGSGKSTILKIISTLINTSDIYYNNKNINEFNIESLRNKICFISNNEYLPSGTIYDFLIANNNQSSEILLKNIDKYKLNSLLDLLDIRLSNVIENGGTNFSLGQKQFISILKIFSSNFSLILLDEIFENIDKNLIDILFPILRKHLKDKIVIEISHQKNYLFNKNEINCELFRKTNN